MSDAYPIPVVFDCTVFAQGLINPRGPGGACLVAAQTRRARVFITDYILREIRELSGKLPPRLGVTAERVEFLMLDLPKFAELVTVIPRIFSYPRDPDDAHYVDLAVETKSLLIVSRDNDLLDIMNDTNPEGKVLRTKFPSFRILTPPEFLSVI